jgi:nitroreductase
MNALQALHTRQSIRQYTSDPVEDRLVNEVLTAGMMAPSAGNERPWQFIVIRHRNTLKAISAHHPYASVVEKAPMAILVCGDLVYDNYDGYWVQDCAAAVENMLVAAHALGLGSVWIGLYPREQRVADIRAILTLPEHVVPMAVLPLGYPAETRAKEERFDKTRIHYDRW